MAARRRTAKKAKPAKGAAKKPAKKKAAKEPKEVKPGPPMEVVCAIITAVMLLGAIILVDFEKGRTYGEGMLFASQYGAE